MQDALIAITAIRREVELLREELKASEIERIAMTKLALRLQNEVDSLKSQASTKRRVG